MIFVGACFMRWYEWWQCFLFDGSKNGNIDAAAELIDI
jgi:hypothetical protein